MDNYKLGVKTSWITVILNIVLAIIKITAGILGSSSAMLADGVHTLSDVMSTFVVILGLKVSSKKPDKEHPYGHERYESIFAKVISILLILTGLYIGYEALQTIIQGNIARPGSIALMAAVFSIITKEIMYQYTIRVAKKIKSISMEADAWHHRSDALSSLGTLVGIFGARLGFTALDPIAGMIVSIFVLKVGVDLYLKSVSELVDESANDETIEKIISSISTVEGVKSINELKTRVFGNRIFVDLDIGVDPFITVEEGHDITKEVHDKLEKDIEDMKHCTVHVEPYKDETNK